MEPRSKRLDMGTREERGWKAGLFHKLGRATLEACLSPSLAETTSLLPGHSTLSSHGRGLSASSAPTLCLHESVRLEGGSPRLGRVWFFQPRQHSYTPSVVSWRLSPVFFSPPACGLTWSYQKCPARPQLLGGSASSGYKQPRLQHKGQDFRKVLTALWSDVIPQTQRAAGIDWTDEWLIGKGWLDRKQNLMREKPWPPSLLGFLNIHAVCLASLHHLQPQGGRMEWERFLAVGETGVADPSICSAYCRSQRVFTISHSGLTITLARMRELAKLSRWKHHASGWESHFPRAEHLGNMGRIPTGSFQLQGDQPAPSRHFSAWTTCLIGDGSRNSDWGKVGGCSWRMGMLMFVSKMLTLSRFLLKFLREKKPCASCQKHSVSSQEGASITHNKKDLKTYRRLADLRDMCTCMP